MPFGLLTKSLRACQVPSGHSECFSLTCRKQVSKISLIFIQQVLSRLWKCENLIYWRCFRKPIQIPKQTLLLYFIFSFVQTWTERGKRLSKNSWWKEPCSPLGIWNFPWTTNTAMCKYDQLKPGFSTRKPTHTSNNGVVSLLLLYYLSVLFIYLM